MELFVGLDSTLLSLNISFCRGGVHTVAPQGKKEPKKKIEEKASANLWYY